MENKQVCILDPSICSKNMGDHIIKISVQEELESLFQKTFFYNLPTQNRIPLPSYKTAQKSDYLFVGGTNLLSSNMLKYKQWHVNLIDFLYLKKVVLMGVGWWQYQKSPGLYTRFLLNNLLDNNILHSVRDNYTKKMLASIGIKNVVNTSCPTMWNLTAEHCSEIRTQKSGSVIFTLTDYNKSYSEDKEFIELLQKLYRVIYFWPQGKGDLDYLANLGFLEEVEVVNPTINSLNKILQEENLELDYVGTRLHAGIRALQEHRRTIIMGIDNRAIEKGRDFNLSVIKRGELQELGNMIETSFKTEIHIPEKEIQKWKEQFI